MMMLDSAEYVHKILEFFGDLFIKEFKDKIVMDEENLEPGRKSKLDNKSHKTTTSSGLSLSPSSPSTTTASTSPSPKAARVMQAPPQRRFFFPGYYYY